jgi:sodium/potassium/calcium exchanger 2
MVGTSTRRALLAAADIAEVDEKDVYEYPNKLSDDEMPQLAGYILLVLYIFVALAIVCDDYFVPALGRISEWMNLSDDIAGATLMAAGGSAPELFTSFIDTFSAKPSGVGFGTIVGSAVFNVLFVIGACAAVTDGDLKLTWWPLFRDCFYYTLSLSMLAVFFGFVTKDKMYLWESLVLLSMYLGYCTVMMFNQKLHTFTYNVYLSTCAPKAKREHAAKSKYKLESGQRE